MTKTDKASEDTTDLESHASGFVAKVSGEWTDTAFAQFRDYLKKIGIFTSEDELRAVVENAKGKFWQGDCRVFLCNALQREWVSTVIGPERKMFEKRQAIALRLPVVGSRASGCE